MTLGKKSLTILTVFIFFIAAGFLNACGRKDEYTDIDPDQVIGQVKLPPLNSGAKNSPAKADIRKTGKKETETEPIPDDINKKLPDFSKYTDIQKKKTEFFNFLRPIVRMENRKVVKERAFVLLAWKKFKNEKEITPEEIQQLNRLAEKYRVKKKFSEGTEFFRKMLIHIDKIPVDLALVQAAKESGWGTSYFAQKGNNLFGQWCFTKGCGLVPRGRPEGATYEVKAFDNVTNSVRAYILNLNSHPAYRELRLQRYRMRLAGGEPDGHYMAKGLEQYSAIGMKYVETVQQMIKGNRKFMGIHGSVEDT